MANENIEPELTEPAVVPCLFCSGVRVEAFDHLIRLRAWVDVPTSAGPEHRTIARLVMTERTARQLRRSLQTAFKSSH